MGILYLDEAGNSGLQDTGQTKLIYGGPYLINSNWKALKDDVAVIQHKYKSLILSRFKSGIQQNTTFEHITNGVSFISDFEIHAAHLANRKGLWSKLTDDEKFDLMEEVVDAMIIKQVTFFIGCIDKQKLRQTVPNPPNMVEYTTLLPAYFKFVSEHIGDHDEFLVIVDDGNPDEKKVIQQSLESSPKALGELIIYDSKKLALLQAADVGVWIYQANTKLTNTRTDPYAQKVRHLSQKLATITKIISLP